MSEARPAPRRAAASRSRGFALFIVLWFLVLLAAIGTYLLAGARSESALARNVVAAAHAEALADAGIAQLVFNLTDPLPDQRWAVDGTPHVVALPEGQLTIRASDETEKINPNIASAKLMSAFFETIGVDRPRALLLGAAVADWVQRPPKGTPPDADLEPYLTAGLDYGPPHRPMESLDELRFVLGMTPEIYVAAAPYLSIYAEADAPQDPRNAPEIVQRAIALAAASQSGLPTPLPTSAIAASTSTAAPPPPAPSQTPDVIDVEVTARGRDGGVFIRRAVLRLDPDEPRGYSVLYWRRGFLGE